MGAHRRAAMVGRWTPCVALIVAVAAMAFADGLSEEAELSADLSADSQKWAYIPDVEDEGAKQKKAMELVAKSEKGRWVNVPVGSTAKDVIEKEELLKAQILSDAAKARGLAELKVKAKDRSERVQKRLLNADEEKAKINTDLKKLNTKLEGIKTSLSGTSDYKAVKRNMEDRKTTMVAIKKLEDKRQELDDLIAENGDKFERRTKSALKEQEKDSKAKAEAQMLKINKLLEEGQSSEGAMQSTLKKFEKHSEDELANVKGLKLKESKSFSDVEVTNDKLESQRKLVNKLLHESDTSEIKTKINTLRARLKSKSKLEEANHAKLVNAEDRESLLSSKTDAMDQTEKSAVSRLQRRFKRAQQKKDDIKKTEADLAAKVAKTTALIKSHGILLAKNQGELRTREANLDKAKAAAAKESSAKQKEAAYKSDNKDLKLHLDALKTKIMHGNDNVKKARAEQHAAALSVDEKEAKKAVAVSANEEADSMDMVIEHAKSTNEISVKDFNQAKATLEERSKKKKKMMTKESEVKKNLKAIQPEVDAHVDLTGPTEQYEVTQKAVKKYQASVADNMAQKEDSQQQLDDSKASASERLASIKQEQSAAVKQARVTRVDM